MFLVNMDELRESPWRIGWTAAKANRLPGAVLWALAATMVVAYYRCPQYAAMLEPLRRFQSSCGILAAVANQVFFCGLIPCAFMLTVKDVRTEHPIAKAALQSVWCGMWGMIFVGIYGLQCRMFGTGHDFATLLAKTVFDQFVWAPLVPVPLSAVFFLWMGSGFSLSAVCAKCRRGFFSRVWLPNLISSWCLWIPAVFAIYAFPPDLQVQVLGFVSSFWALMCLQIGKKVAVP